MFGRLASRIPILKYLCVLCGSARENRRANSVPSCLCDSVLKPRAERRRPTASPPNANRAVRAMLPPPISWLRNRRDYATSFATFVTVFGAILCVFVFKSFCAISAAHYTIFGQPVNPRSADGCPTPEPKIEQPPTSAPSGARGGCWGGWFLTQSHRDTEARRCLEGWLREFQS